MTKFLMGGDWFMTFCYRLSETGGQLGTLRSLKDIEFLFIQFVEKSIVFNQYNCSTVSFSDKIILMNQQKIRLENKELRELIQNYMEEIQRLKDVNEKHQHQIDTLLKFNDRLLTIIESQLNQYKSKRSERSLSLQRISERTESEYIDGVQSIKASLLSNFGVQIPQIQQRNLQKVSNNKFEVRSGHETQRIHLGNHLQEAMSYEGAHSEYQKDMSESKSNNHKLRDVMSLISNYKKQYGKSRDQYNKMRQQIRKQFESQNQQLQQFNSQNETFYDQKINEMDELRKQMQSTEPQRHLENIIKDSKYSMSTQNKLIKIMNGLNI